VLLQVTQEDTPKDLTRLVSHPVRQFVRRQPEAKAMNFMRIRSPQPSGLSVHSHPTERGREAGKPTGAEVDGATGDSHVVRPTRRSLRIMRKPMSSA
ncbi:unnamed protein product, partial [Nesidiocoris tenuis]